MENTMNTNATAIENADALDLSALSSAEILEMLNAEPDLNKHAPMKKALDEVLKAENKEHYKQAIATFAHEYDRDSGNFWATFIDSPYAPRYSLAEDDEADERYSLKQSNRRVSFTKVDSKYQEEHNGQTIANAKNYPRMVARFTDNVYRKVCSDLSAGCSDTRAVIRVTFHGKDEDFQKEIDFSKTGAKAMKAQMQAIVDTILPAEHSVLVQDADLAFVLKAAERTNLDKGEVSTSNEDNILDAIMRAVRNIKNGEAYTVKSKAKCHKAPKPKAKKSERTEKQEEVMSRVPDREHEIPTSKTENTQAA